MCGCPFQCSSGDIFLPSFAAASSRLQLAEESLSDDVWAQNHVTLIVDSGTNQLVTTSGLFCQQKEVNSFQLAKLSYFTISRQAILALIALGSSKFPGNVDCRHAFWMPIIATKGEAWEF
jgi:hypothetical protein